MAKRPYPNLKKSFQQNTRKMLPAMLEDFLLRQELVIGHPLRIKELHRLRISGKPLRYTMEIFRYGFAKEFKLCLARVEEAIELMGSIHDCDVFIETLQDFLRELKIFNQIAASHNDRFEVNGVRLLVLDQKHKRNEAFLRLSKMLNTWKNDDFKRKVLEAIKPTN